MPTPSGSGKRSRRTPPAAQRQKASSLAPPASPNRRKTRRPERARASRLRHVPLILILAAASGTTSLVYESLWARVSSLYFGSAPAATAVVLAVFMGGLGLGSGLVAKYMRRIPLNSRFSQPLLAYAACELGIGILALLTPLVLSASGSLQQAAWRASGGSLLLLTLVRIAVAAAALLPPAILMGATFPLLARLCEPAPIGLVYSANLLGAVFGSLLAGFWLIPSLGVGGALHTAAALNGAISLAAVLSSPRVQVTFADAASPVEGSARILLLYAFSGAIGMIYEVAWTRALSLVVGSTVYAFALMLATFLLGLLAGTLIASLISSRLRHPLTAFALAQAAVGLGAAFGCAIFGQLPWLSLVALKYSLDSGVPILPTRCLVAALALLPTSLFLGSLFPLALRAAAPDAGTPPAPYGGSGLAGALYAWNTIGSVAGSLLAGFLLTPVFGVEWTLRTAVAASFILAAVCLPRPAAIGAAALTGAILMVAMPRWDNLLLVMIQSVLRDVPVYVKTYGAFPYESAADLSAQIHQDQQLLFHHEGRSSDVAVIRNQVNTSLLTNGYADGSDRWDMPTQILLGALPMLLQPSGAAPPRVALIGWGTGVTAGVVEQTPLRHLTALEIEPEVIRASTLFHPVNHQAESDPRLSIIPTDGRNYLLSAPVQFDVILSEPSNVWQAGVSSLFTREFFHLCRQRLRPGGLLAQWIGYGAMPPAEMRGIAAALRQELPYALLFRVDQHDAIFVASDQPVLIPAAASDRLQNAPPALRSDLARAGAPDIGRLAAHLALGPNEMDRFIAGERPNTDDNARLEFAAAGSAGSSFEDQARIAIDSARDPDPREYLAPLPVHPPRNAAR